MIKGGQSSVTVDGRIEKEMSVHLNSRITANTTLTLNEVLFCRNFSNKGGFRT